MKQLLLLTAFLFAVTFAYSQSDSEDSLKSSKSHGANYSTELNFNPFNGQLNLNNSLNQIKFRYFVKSGLALRLGFNLNQKDSTANYNDPYGINSSFSNSTMHTTEFGINFGFEKHLEGTTRLSPYFGVDIFYANKSSNETIANNESTTTVKGAWLSYAYTTDSETQTVSENGYERYGVNLVAGFDFYIARHFFVGYEFALSLSKTNYDNVGVVVTGQGATDNSSTSSTVSAFNFGTSLMNGVRVGYTF